MKVVAGYWAMVFADHMASSVFVVHCFITEASPKGGIGSEGLSVHRYAHTNTQHMHTHTHTHTYSHAPRTVVVSMNPWLPCIHTSPPLPQPQPPPLKKKRLVFKLTNRECLCLPLFLDTCRILFLDCMDPYMLCLTPECIIASQ